MIVKMIQNLENKMDLQINSLETRIEKMQGLFKKELQPSRLQKGDPKHSNLNKMNRQRNIQQAKEHEKNPPNQTKEEETGNLPEKEFRIMIVKMIQNIENKMNLQINRLEIWIENMQEMFSKDLKEIKKSRR